jgi:hypothetical protein
VVDIVPLVGDGVAPAWTLVMLCGATMDWKTLRAALGGMICVALWLARKLAFVTALHSCSGLAIKSKTGGKVALFRVVSMWKTLTALSRISPILFIEPCIAEFGGSIRERVFLSVSALWWWRIDE